MLFEDIPSNHFLDTLDLRMNYTCRICEEPFQLYAGNIDPDDDNDYHIDGAFLNSEFPLGYMRDCFEQMKSRTNLTVSTSTAPDTEEKNYNSPSNCGTR